VLCTTRRIDDASSAVFGTASMTGSAFRKPPD